jgi:hypothetical protein
MSIGLWIAAQITEDLKVINAQRAKLKLPPATMQDYLAASNSLAGKTKDYSKGVYNILTKPPKAPSIPKGTLTGLVDDVINSAAVTAPAAAIGVGLEKLRQRKNKVAATKAAAPKAPTAAPTGIAEKSKRLLAAEVGGKAGVIVQGAMGGWDALGSAVERASDKVDSTMTFEPVETRPFNYPIGASPVGMGFSPMAGKVPDMRRDAAIAREVLSDPKFYGDTIYNTMNSITMGGLDRNKELNRRSSMDGNLSVMEGASNFLQSVGEIPLDVVTGGAYDYYRYGPEFSPLYGMAKEAKDTYFKDKESNEAIDKTYSQFGE